MKEKLPEGNCNQQLFVMHFLTLSWRNPWEMSNRSKSTITFADPSGTYLALSKKKGNDENQFESFAILSPSVTPSVVCMQHSYQS